MKSRLDILHKKSQEYSLHDDERSAIRESLMDYMEKHPIQSSHSSQKSTFVKPLLLTAVVALAVVAGMLFFRNDVASTAKAINVNMASMIHALGQ